VGYRDEFMSATQDAFEKLAGFTVSENCLSDILKELLFGEKCIKCVHHKKNRSRLIKKTIIGIQWWNLPQISMHCPQNIPDTKNIMILCDE